MQAKLQPYIAERLYTAATDVCQLHTQVLGQLTASRHDLVPGGCCFACGYNTKALYGENYIHKVCWECMNESSRQPTHKGALTNIVSMYPHALATARHMLHHAFMLMFVTRQITQVKMVLHLAVRCVCMRHMKYCATAWKYPGHAQYDGYLCEQCSYEINNSMRDMIQRQVLTRAIIAEHLVPDVGNYLLSVVCVIEVQ